MISARSSFIQSVEPDMYLKEALKIRRTLVFRLTFLYSVVFTVSSLAAFTVFYIVISNVIKVHADQVLLKEMAEAVSILKSKGEDSFKTEMDIEAEAEGPPGSEAGVGN
jgi:hypothetical protein